MEAPAQLLKQTVHDLAEILPGGIERREERLLGHELVSWIKRSRCSAAKRASFASLGRFMNSTLISPV